MGARQKLNDLYVTGSLAVATAVGLTSGSWFAFLAALGVLLGMGCLGGDVRPARRGR